MDGVILINKPQGYTSRDVVNIVSKVLMTKKVGHTGTLDPLAEGLLIVTVGKFNKMTAFFMADEKEYIVEAKLGRETDTLDLEGKTVKKSNKKITKDELNQVLNQYRTTYMQEVPLYSAVKVNGMKLYEYARNNIEVELPKKEVTIKEIELLSFNEDVFKIKVVVSKGTYVRSLIRDIGETLGCYAVMTGLVRTRIGQYMLNDANDIEDVKKGNIKYLDIPIDIK